MDAETIYTLPVADDQRGLRGVVSLRQIVLISYIAATLTINVLQSFEETLESVVTLPLFIPLLIDTGLVIYFLVARAVLGI